MAVVFFLILGVFGWTCFFQSSYYAGFPKTDTEFSKRNQRLELFWTMVGVLSIVLGFYFLFAIGHVR